jgi:hypothetical protein
MSLGSRVRPMREADNITAKYSVTFLYVDNIVLHRNHLLDSTACYRNSFTFHM